MMINNNYNNNAPRHGAVMALIGMALYATTYALMYAATSNATVPVLEMWMTTTHVACTALSLFIGIAFSNVQQKNIVPSIFLGVACSVTVLGNDCIQYGGCALYFGAATLPRLAAAGAIAWAWIMFVVSFDSSMPNTFVAAMVMAMVPLAIETKTLSMCGDKWEPQLLDEGGKSYMIWIRAGVAITILLLDLFFRRGIFVVQPVVMWLMQPHGAKTSASPLAYYIATVALVLISFFNFTPHQTRGGSVLKSGLGGRSS